MKRKFSHLSEVKGEKVTSEELKTPCHRYGFQKSLHPSGTETPIQEISLRTGMAIRKPVSSAETQNFPRRSLLPPNSHTK